MFSDAAHSCRWNSGRIWPEKWRPDCFPHTLLGLKGTPEGLEKPADGPLDIASLPFDRDILRLGLYEMEKDPSTGVFSRTIPLPSDTYSYRFVLDIPNGDPLFMQTMPDPTNPPLLPNAFSQIYVPFDPARQTDDRSIEAPIASESRLETGVCRDIPLVVYLPAGDSPAGKYPTLYLSAGGGDSETSWVTQGAAKAILDHLIADGRLEPTIVVMMNYNLLGWNSDACIAHLTQALVPQIEAAYAADPRPARRAFAGFSAGGLFAFDLYAARPAEFGYFGIWSGGQRGECDFSRPALHRPVLHIGAGLYDDAFYAFAYPLQDKLDAAGIAFSSRIPRGGHQWAVWRKILEDFAGRVLWKERS